MQAAVKRGENGSGGWKKAIILAIGWILIFSLARDVWQIRSGFRRIDDASERLEAEKTKNLALRDRLDLVMTEEYKEKLIREKLNMQKEGEVIVVMPEGKTEETNTNSEANGGTEENWVKWWNLVK